MDITAETMDLVMVSETTVMNMIMTLLVVIIMVMDIMDHMEEVMIVGGNMVQSTKVSVLRLKWEKKLNNSDNPVDLWVCTFLN